MSEQLCNKCLQYGDDCDCLDYAGIHALKAENADLKKRVAETDAYLDLLEECWNQLHNDLLDGETTFIWIGISEKIEQTLKNAGRLREGPNGN